MKNFSFVLAVLFFLLVPFYSISQYPVRISYPVTNKTNQIDEYHGTKVADPYRWLEDDTSAATKAWVLAENKVTSEYLSKIPYREKLKKRIRELYDYPKYRDPFLKAGYLYYYKNNGLQNQAVLYRQKGRNGITEVVIDPNKLSPDGTTRLGAFSLSKDGKYAVYSLSKGGSDWETYYVKDMIKGTDLPDQLGQLCGVLRHPLGSDHQDGNDHQDDELPAVDVEHVWTS